MSATPEERTAIESLGSPRYLDAALGEVDWCGLPPGAVRDRVAVPSGSLARISMGPADGERVVFVPGVTGSKEDFVLMLPIFAAAGYRAEAYDMAGQFESAGAGPEHLDPPQQHYTLKLFTDDLIAVLESGRTPAHVLGYSFAGTVTAQVAVERPDLFSSLTLLSAPPLPGQSLRGFKAVGALSYAFPGPTLGRLFFLALRFNLNRAPAHRAVFVKARLELTRRSSVEDVLGLMKRTPDFADALRATGIPILVSTGSGDVWKTSAYRAFAAQAGARVLILPTGHSPCETAPHQLAEAMLELMRG